MLRGTRMDTPVRGKAPHRRPCAVRGCLNLARAHGICWTHLQRKKRGDVAWERPIIPRHKGHRVEPFYVPLQVFEVVTSRAKSRQVPRTVLAREVLCLWARGLLAVHAEDLLGGGL